MEHKDIVLQVLVHNRTYGGGYATGAGCSGDTRTWYPRTLSPISVRSTVDAMTTSPDDLESPQDLKLENQLCFALHAASRAVTELYRPLLNELGVTYPQYLVLLVLWERDTRPIKDITESLQLDYGTVSPLLKRLESHGLVTRNRASDNESRVLVSLTPAGRGLRARAAGIPRALRCALQSFDEVANSELIDTLQQVTATAQAADPLTLATTEILATTDDSRSSREDEQR